MVFKPDKSIDVRQNMVKTRAKTVSGQNSLQPTDLVDKMSRADFNIRVH